MNARVNTGRRPLSAVTPTSFTPTSCTDRLGPTNSNHAAIGCVMAGLRWASPQMEITPDGHHPAAGLAAAGRVAGRAFAFARSSASGASRNVTPSSNHPAAKSVYRPWSAAGTEAALTYLKPACLYPRRTTTSENARPVPPSSRSAR